MSFDKLFLSRKLHESEMSSDAPNRDTHIRVLKQSTPTNLDGLRNAFRQYSHDISNNLSQHGALLFRGCAFKSMQDAEDSIMDLGFDLEEQYLGGLSPRSSLTGRLFCSSEVPAPYIISQHTEMCYLKSRPRKVVFYCDKKPEKYGETPIFDAAKMYERLEPSIRERIEQQGLIYERYFPKNKAILNVYKQWSKAFYANSKEEAEKNCERQGLEFEWTDSDCLITRTRMPGVVVHPQTQKKCLSFTLFNEFAACIDINTFKHRYNPLKRMALTNFNKLIFARKNPFFLTLWGNGQRMTNSETKALLEASWDCSTLFNWQQGDLLLLDNILSGHGRLNVVSERNIAAGLCDLYDIDKPIDKPQAA